MQPSTFLKTGVLQGAFSGFFSAALFIMLVVIILPSATGSCSSSECIFVSLIISVVATFIGVIPATVIGAVSGLIMAGIFHSLQGYLLKHQRLQYLVLVPGVFVALVGIVLWTGFILNDFRLRDLTSLHNSYPLSLIFGPFAVFAGIHVVWKLREVASER